MLGFFVIEWHGLCNMPQEQLDFWMVGHDGPGIPSLITPRFPLEFIKWIYRYPAAVIFFYFPNVCAPTDVAEHLQNQVMRPRPL